MKRIRGVVWCGVMWCGVMWCDVARYVLMPTAGNCDNCFSAIVQALVV
jgi:hypothetical protein